MINKFLSNLQNKSEQTKNRIFWSASIIATVVVATVWFGSFKREIQSISGTDLNLNAQQSQESAPHYLKLEGAEQTNDKLAIYFSVNNDSEDILNFSTNNDIDLLIGGKKSNPVSVTNRQGDKFVEKVLSHQEQFGIATFDNIADNTGTITFDNLYFEQTPSNIFKETLELDLKKLSKPLDIRN